MKVEKSEYSHPSTTLVIEIFASRNVKKRSLCLQYRNSCCHNWTCERIEKLGDQCFPSLHFLLLPDIPLNSVPRPFLLLLWFSCQVASDSVMGFPRQEYWSGLPFSNPGDLLDPRIKPTSLTLQADSLPPSHLGSPSLITKLNLLLDVIGWEIESLSYHRHSNGRCQSCVCVCVCVYELNIFLKKLWDYYKYKNICT